MYSMAFTNCFINIVLKFPIQMDHSFMLNWTMLLELEKLITCDYNFGKT